MHWHVGTQLQRVFPIFREKFTIFSFTICNDDQQSINFSINFDRVTSVSCHLCTCPRNQFPRSQGLGSKSTKIQTTAAKCESIEAEKIGIQISTNAVFFFEKKKKISSLILCHVLRVGALFADWIRRETVVRARATFAGARPELCRYLFAVHTCVSIFIYIQAIPGI